MLELILYVLISVVLTGFAIVATMDLTGRMPRIPWLQNDRVIPWLALTTAGAMVLTFILREHGMAVRLGATTFALAALLVLTIGIVPLKEPEAPPCPSP